MTVSLNGQTIALTQKEVALVHEATRVELVDLHDGIGVDLQAYVPRLGGWTNIVNFKEARDAQSVIAFA